MLDFEAKSHRFIWGAIILTLAVGVLLWLLHKVYKQGRQDNDVWNISGRLNHQGLDSWPTHDHHVSIDSFAFPPEYQAKDSRSAPPPYTEVDLPTYEEAISACANHKTTTLPVPVHAAVHQSRSNAEV